LQNSVAILNCSSFKRMTADRYCRSCENLSKASGFSS
jgi:hypothetical protein